MSASPTNSTSELDPRVYYAAERTLLAWVRTGVAMMGFGFVVARFGLFLRELATVEHAPAETTGGLSVWFGSALILLGVVVNLWAAFDHRRDLLRYQRGEQIFPRRISLGLVLAVLLAMLGLLIGGYLFVVSE